MYVDDCAEAIRRVTESGKIGEIYNIGWVREGWTIDQQAIANWFQDWIREMQFAFGLATPSKLFYLKHPYIFYLDRNDPWEGAKVDGKVGNKPVRHNNCIQNF